MGKRLSIAPFSENMWNGTRLITRSLVINHHLLDISQTGIATGKHVMSQINSSWLSYRQAHSKQSNISLLPQFSVPPGVTDFAIENKPPHLPPRNSQSSVCVWTVATVLCLVGSYYTVSAAAGPVLQHSTRLVSGMSVAIRNAILHANQEAERHAQRHYEARDEYMSRRRVSPRASAPGSEPKPQDDDTSGWYDNSAPATMPTPRHTRTSRPKSALLLRMAALRKTDSSGSSIDENAVEQFFPGWVQKRQNSMQWNEDAVLQDLVLAVSQLAHAVSIDADTREGVYVASPSLALDAPPEEVT